MRSSSANRSAMLRSSSSAGGQETAFPNEVVDNGNLRTGAPSDQSRRSATPIIVHPPKSGQGSVKAVEVPNAGGVAAADHLDRYVVATRRDALPDSLYGGIGAGQPKVVQLELVTFVL